MYRINIHAHTIFSDGANTPYRMALEAKRIGLTSLVVTDHYYGPEYNIGESITRNKMHLLEKACKEAKSILPVIIGLELAFGGEEMLVFGSAVIKEILNCGEQKTAFGMETLLQWKKKHDCAFILCHPGEEKNWEKLLPLLDGYEEFNSGDNMFKAGDIERSRGCLSGLPGWCNSDAHNAGSLHRGHNIVDTKIETETDLIRYIKRRKQPVFSLQK